MGWLDLLSPPLGPGQAHSCATQGQGFSGLRQQGGAISAGMPKALCSWPPRAPGAVRGPHRPSPPAGTATDVPTPQKRLT